MTEINEINAIIEKNLPAHVGAVLKKTLEKAEADAKLVEAKSKENDRLNTIITDLNNKITEYSKKDELYNSICNREEAVNEAERNQKVFIAETKLTEAEKRASEIAGFTGMVFKSPIFRKSISSSFGYSDIYGGDGQYHNQKTSLYTDESLNEE